MATHTTVTVQQPQASTYNHPCGDLLNGGRRRDYLDIGVPLYTASMEGDLEAAKVILQSHGYLVRYSITERKETPLHVAVMGRSIEFVRYLVNMMGSVDLELQNEDGNTAFCIAAISGNVCMAKLMFEKNSALPIICGSENMMPLYLAAMHKNRDMVTFLYDQTDRMMGSGWTSDSRNGVLLKCLEARIFDVALQILEGNEELPHQDKHLWDMLQGLASYSWAFFENHPRTDPFYVVPYLQEVYLLKKWKKRNATPVLRLLWKRIMEYPKDVIDEILRGPLIMENNLETYPSQILFITAKENNTQFLVELIRGYPDLLWKRNDDGQTIFHVAVSHRHHDIYNLLYEIGSMKDLIIPITDNQGNNILHLAGNSPHTNAYAYWVTSPLLMRSEYLWYKEVRSILPIPSRNVKNAAGQTPQELFIENHKDHVSQGVKWIYGTVNLSMVVAALVCTIGFSLVLQVPGGFDQQKGYPIFLHNLPFIAFLSLVSISFFLSTTSIFYFLSIFLSYQHRSIEALIIVWTVAQLLLFSSVLFLVLAFVLSFFILYLKGKWKPLIGFAIMFLYCILWLDTLVLTVTSPFAIRFRPRKHRLYSNMTKAS